MGNENTRTRSWLDSPSWRWDQACAYLKDERAGIVPVTPTDPLVQLLCRVARAWGTIEGREVIREFWEPLYGAIYMGTFGKDSSVTAQTDALILQRFEPESEAVMTLPIDELTYALYASIFFDVKGMTDAHTWLQDQVIECETGKKDKPKRLRARLLAMVGTVEDTTDITVTGKGGQSAVTLMRRMIGCERWKKAFDYNMQKRMLDDHEYALAMESTTKDLLANGTGESGGDSVNLDDLVNGMEESVRMLRTSETIAPSGEDPTNAYLPGIIGTKDE
jgi:hypothetical protein